MDAISPRLEKEKNLMNQIIPLLMEWFATQKRVESLTALSEVEASVRELKGIKNKIYDIVQEVGVELDIELNKVMQLRRERGG